MNWYENGSKFIVIALESVEQCFIWNSRKILVCVSTVWPNDEFPISFQPIWMGKFENPPFYPVFMSDSTEIWIFFPDYLHKRIFQEIS